MIVVREVTADTVFVSGGGGGDTGSATAVFHLRTALQGIAPAKCVFEAEFQGQCSIVKYWPIEQERR